MKLQTRQDLANAQEIVDQRLFEVLTATTSLTKSKHIVILSLVLAVVVLAKKIA